MLINKDHKYTLAKPTVIYLLIIQYVQLGYAYITYVGHTVSLSEQPVWGSSWGLWTVVIKPCTGYLHWWGVCYCKTLFRKISLIYLPWYWYATQSNKSYFDKTGRVQSFVWIIWKHLCKFKPTLCIHCKLFFNGDCSVTILLIYPRIDTFRAWKDTFL